MKALLFEPSSHTAHAKVSYCRHRTLQLIACTASNQLHNLPAHGLVSSTRSPCFSYPSSFSQQHQQYQASLPCSRAPQPQLNNRLRRSRLSPLYFAPVVTHAATAAADSAISVVASTAFRKLLGRASGVFAIVKEWPVWALGIVMLVGMTIGFVLAKIMAKLIRQDIDFDKLTKENVELKSQVTELQEMVARLTPLASNSRNVTFTKGINKAVIMKLLDAQVAKNAAHTWWMPGQLEKELHHNVTTLMASLFEDIIDSTSITFAGHTIRLQLSHMDLPRSPSQSRVALSEEAVPSAAVAPAAAETAEQPPGPDPPSAAAAAANPMPTAGAQMPPVAAAAAAAAATNEQCLAGPDDGPPVKRNLDVM